MSNQPHDNGGTGRRQFLKLGALSLAATAVASKFMASTSHAQAAKNGAAKGGDKALTMVKPTEPMAQSLGYVEDASKVDTKKFPKRAGPEGAKQYCYNCQFYVVPSGDPKATKAAPCTIFANKGVAAKGWCNSWVQNPKVKG